MSINNFSKMFPTQTNKRLHILLSILAVLIVIGSIVAYQVSKVDTSEDVVSLPDPTALTPEQRTHALTELKAVASKSPPVTDTQRAKALAELKRIANQKK